MIPGLLLGLIVQGKVLWRHAGHALLVCHLILWQLFEMWCAAPSGCNAQQTFTVSASAELGASSELLLSPGPFPIRKLTSRSLSQLLPPSACMKNACSS